MYTYLFTLKLYIRQNSTLVLEYEENGENFDTRNFKYLTALLYRVAQK